MSEEGVQVGCMLRVGRRNDYRLSNVCIKSDMHELSRRLHLRLLCMKTKTYSAQFSVMRAIMADSKINNLYSAN